MDYRANLAGLIQYALERMRTEDYKKCIACEGDISHKRLFAVPESSFCIICQERLDKGDLDGFERWSLKTLAIGG